MRVESFVTEEDHEVSLDDLVVLVGPNNTGKSQTLSDLHRTVSDPNSHTTIIRDAEIDLPETFDELQSTSQFKYNDRHNRMELQGISSNLTDSHSYSNVDRDQLEGAYDNGRIRPILNAFGEVLVAYLDTSSRLRVAQSAPGFNAEEEPPSNLLQSLFIATEGKDEQLRSAFNSAFNKDIYFDYSGMTQWCFRIGDEFTEIPADPRDARPILGQYDQLDTQGDGYRSFVGVVLSVLLSKNRIILLDEPEAFLHPAQARVLGRWISEYAARSTEQIVIATHNSNFLGGIIDGNSDPTIYRLNRDREHTVYNPLSSDITERLAVDPLLSNQRILEAVFHEGVVVCEADSDRAVYQTVASKELETEDVLYTHAHNKQTIKRVANVLRRANIPVVGVVDFDIVRDHHTLRYALESLTDEPIDEMLELRSKVEETIQAKDDSDILSAMIPKVEDFLEELIEGEHNLDGSRAAIGRLRKQFSEWNMPKKNGIYGVPDEAQVEAEKLVELASEEGLFIVPTGELESWMDLGVSKKSKWVVKALDTIEEGECPPHLIEFLEEIHQHLDSEYQELVDNSDAVSG